MSDVFGAGSAVAGVAQATAMITVGILQYKTWQDQIDKADAIARRIQDREDEKHDLWVNVYRNPEIATVNEITAEPVPTVNYGTVRQRVEATYRSATDRAKTDALFYMDNQCVGAKAEVARELDLRAAGLTAFGIEAAMRAEEMRIEVKKRQRVADRLTILGHGRQVHHESGSALNGAMQQYQFAAQQAAGAFNGALQSLGALARRSEQNTGRGTGAQQPGAKQLDYSFGSVRLGQTDTDGYGAFPRPGSGDSAALAPNYSLASFNIAQPVNFGDDPGSGGSSATTNLSEFPGANNGTAY